MPAFNFVRASFYQDSVTLMRLSRDMEAVPGVTAAAAMMGTPHNRELLQQAGLLAPEGAAAGPADLVIAVIADSPAAADAARAAAEHALLARRAIAVGNTTAAPPRTLTSALKILPDANLALISVPGAYAGAEATEVVCLVGKPPGAGVARRLADAAAKLGKPCVAYFAGASTPAAGPWRVAATLEDAGRAAVALARGTTPAATAFTLTAAEVERLVADAARGLAP